MWSIFNNYARALARTLIQGADPLLSSCRCGDYWCNIDAVNACALLKISVSPFCVIPFHSCLFVLAFVSFFLDSCQKFFFLVL